MINRVWWGLNFGSIFHSLALFRDITNARHPRQRLSHRVDIWCINPLSSNQFAPLHPPKDRPPFHYQVPHHSQAAHYLLSALVFVCLLMHLLVDPTLYRHARIWLYYFAILWTQLYRKETSCRLGYGSRRRFWRVSLHLSCRSWKFDHRCGHTLFLQMVDKCHPRLRPMHQAQRESHFRERSHWYDVRRDTL